MAKNNVKRQLSIFINDREVVNSLGGIDREMAKVRGQLKNLVKGTDDYDKKLKEHKDSLAKLKVKQQEYKEELYDTNITATEAKEAFTKLYTGIISGNIGMATEGFNGLKGSIFGVVKAGLALIAIPIGLILTGITAAFVGAKKIFEYNQELFKLNEQLRALGIESQNFSKFRSEIQATAQTFDKEFKDIAVNANSLSKTFEISITEANKLIARGLADGNGEFLDSLSEYDEFFAKAGFSAQEYIDILNTGLELGIYTDKLPDAIKEADLSLREATTATRDALINAFGASFTDKILAQVSSGEKTTKQALDSIAKKAQETQLSQQQQAQLTADVFRGAGEDAGGALKIFEAIALSTQRELDKTAKAQIALQESTAKLNKVQAELFEIEDFGDIWTMIKVSATDTLTAILEYIVDLKKDIQPLIDIVGVLFTAQWETLKFTVSSVFNIVAGILKAFATSFKALVKGVGQLLNGDFSGALKTFKTGFQNVFANLGNVFVKIKNSAIDAIKGLIEASSILLETIGVDVDKLKEKLDGLKSKEFKITGDTENQTESTSTNTETNTTLVVTKSQEQLDREKKEAEKRKRLREKYQKEELAKAKALADAKIAYAKSELDYFIKSNRSRLEKNQELSYSLINQEKNRLEKIKEEQLKFLETELDANLLSAQKKAKTEEELILLKKTLNNQFQIAKQSIELKFLEETDALTRGYEQQKEERDKEEEELKKQLKLEQLALEKELELAEAETKAEEDRITQEQAYTADLERFEKALNDKKITQDQYDRFKQKAKEKQDELNRVRELQLVQQTLGGLNTLAQAAGALFGQSKELAIIQAGINGAMAVTSILAQWPKFDGGFAMYTAIAAAGFTTAAQIKEITKSKAPKTPKFYYGGFTGNTPALGVDQYGPITGHVHKNEYVVPEIMTQDPVFADTLSWLEYNRKEKLRSKGFVDGGPTTQGTIPQSENATQSINNNAMLIETLTTLNSILSSGISANVLFGYEEAKNVQDLNDEIQQSNQNGTLSQ